MTTSHLDDPWATIHDKDGRGKLRDSYRVDGPFDLMFHRSQSRKRGIQSKIPNLSIGDVRQSFVQLRMMGPSLTSDTMLFSGMTAGRFALLYIIKTYKGAKTRRRKNMFDREQDDAGAGADADADAEEDANANGGSDQTRVHGHRNGRPCGLSRRTQLLQGDPCRFDGEALLQECRGVRDVEGAGVLLPAE